MRLAQAENITDKDDRSTACLILFFSSRTAILGDRLRPVNKAVLFNSNDNFVSDFDLFDYQLVRLRPRQ